ncbi:hypothetical protein [Streptoalloteichus hindustanus]|uniref:hypothetical protein n=1 Tax=Streptoalloteichus hindustanus TaxID=2017 RepID=UPI000935F930|nr:hypothetical protein [Streptoalloteichus hindustanus]
MSAAPALCGSRSAPADAPRHEALRRALAGRTGAVEPAVTARRSGAVRPPPSSAPVADTWAIFPGPGFTRPGR